MLSHGCEASIEIFNSFPVSLLDHAPNLLPLCGAVWKSVGGNFLHSSTGVEE